MSLFRDVKSLQGLLDIYDHRIKGVQLAESPNSWGVLTSFDMCFKSLDVVQPKIRVNYF